LVTGAHADTYNVATNWAQTYTSTAAVASGNDHWGLASGVGTQQTAWSAGTMSFNATNEWALNGPASNFVNSTQGSGGGTSGDGAQYLLNYYLPSSGSTTTTANSYTGGTTYNYTVPFATYQFIPGTTIQQQVGATLANQASSGKSVYDAQPGNTGNSGKAILPSGVTVSSATTTSGTLQYIAATEKPGTNGNTIGFTTTSYNPSGGHFSDGGGSVQAATDGVFYNYGTSTASTGVSGLNFPTSSTSNSVVMSDFFAGPTYVAWTAPQGGYITIGVLASDHNDDDGNPGFYIIDPSKGNFETGAAQPGLLFSAGALSFSNVQGSQVNPGTMQNAPVSYLGGTLNDYNPNMGTGYVPGAYGSATATTSGSNDPTIGLSWQSSTNAMYVTTGETLFFVADTLASGLYDSHSNHIFGYGKDSVSLSANIVLQTVPEPGSIVLLGIAGIGLALAAWKRRRVAA
jgi:hypothetical protein